MMEHTITASLYNHGRHRVVVSRELSALASCCDVLIRFENANNCEGTFKTDLKYHN